MNHPKLKPSTIRMRRLVERRRKGITIPNCLSCGAKCVSPQSIKEEMCSQCRRVDIEGRAKAIRDAYKSMDRRTKFEALEARVGSAWEWKDAKTSTPSHTNKVAIETLRGARTVATYSPEFGWIDTIDGGKIRVRYWAEIPPIADLEGTA